MTRKIRFAFRVATVASLCTLLTFSPASAGWFLKRFNCQPKCTPCPPLCPEPVVVCCEPVVVCPDPCQLDPCANASGAMAAPMPAAESVVPAESFPSDLPPSAVEPTPAPTEQPTPGESLETPPAVDDNVASPSDTAVLEDETPVEPAPVAPSPFDEPAAPVEEPAPVVEEPAPVVEEPAPVVEEPAPVVEEPAPVVEEPAPVVEEPAPPAEDGVGDLFDTPEATPAEEPAPVDPPADTPAPAGDDAFDLFGDEPATDPAPADPVPADPAPAGDDPAPAGDDPAPAGDDPAPAGDGLDDLFGEEPAALPPAEGDGDVLGDLFDTPADTPADTPEPAPADAGDDGLGDLFGEPVDPTPAGGDAGDDLFNDPLNPASTDKPAKDDKAKSIFDELFGQNKQAAPQVAPVVEPTPAVQTVVVSKSSNSPLDSTENRLWIDNTGSFSTEGRLILVTDQFVRLLKPNGRTCTVPADRLSPSDAQYVAKIRAAVPTAADLVAVSK